MWRILSKKDTIKVMNELDLCSSKIYEYNTILVGTCYFGEKPNSYTQNLINLGDDLYHTKEILRELYTTHFWEPFNVLPDRKEIYAINRTLKKLYIKWIQFRLTK